MSAQVRSHVQSIGCGLATACVFLGLMFLGRLIVGVPLVPEQIADIVFARVPLTVFALTLGLLGAWAKPVAFLCLVGVYLLGLTIWGWGTMRWITAKWPIHPWLGGWLSAALLWALTVGGLSAQSSTRQTGDDFLFSVGTLFLLHGIYGSGLALCCCRQPGWTEKTVSVSQRRRAIQGIVTGLCVITVYGFLSRVRSLAEAVAATVADVVQKIQGLPPEVTPVGKFYTISKNVFDPVVDAKTWRLHVKGLVERPYTLTYDELRGLPAVEQYATLECISNEVGGNLISNALWKGAPLRDLLNRAGIKTGATELILRARDGYSDSFPLHKALAEGTILAWEMNGVSLPKQHGFPARVIVPGIYGMKNVKWLTELEIADYDYKGYWESRGWSDEAIYKTMSRIDVPAAGQVDPHSPYLGGIAFAGDRGIKGVEVSLDGGTTWRQAMLKPALSPYTWVLWALEWDPAADLLAGSHAVQVRAVDGTGTVQIAVGSPPLPDGASGYHTVRLTRKA